MRPLHAKAVVSISFPVYAEILCAAADAGYRDYNGGGLTDCLFFVNTEFLKYLPARSSVSWPQQVCGVNVALENRGRVRSNESTRPEFELARLESL